MESGSASIPSGCNDLGLDRNNSLRVPSDSSDPVGSPKTREISSMPHDPDHTPLAAPDVVSEAHADAGGETADSANEMGPDSHIGGSSSSEADDPDNQIDCMAHFIGSFRSQLPRLQERQGDRQLERLIIQESSDINDGVTDRRWILCEHL